MLIIHAQDPRPDSFCQVFFHDRRHDSSFSSLFYILFKCPVRPGLTCKRCVVMVIIIAARGARDA